MARDDSDRRAHPRAPVELKVEYRKRDSFLADYTKNISKGGMFVRTDYPLDVGTELLFRMSVPSLPEPLSLRGQVTWVVREGEPPPPGVDPNQEPGMGIRFIFADEAERSAVESRVENLMIRSLGARLYSRLFTKEPERK
ncbi:MAG: TIGR02266 family protein [Deltaproteobacteria bacterium]|nr:TIGR02266 family protein [Deltaproteobacteria bacterium]